MAQPKIAVSNQFKIEKGVPLPSRLMRARSYYPFGDMEISDSFQVEGADNARKLKSAASYFGIRNGKRFTVRVTNREGIPVSARCWRVA